MITLVDISASALACYLATTSARRIYLKEADMPWNYVQVDDDADCAGQEDPSIAHEADSASPISLDGIMSIDHAVESTIASMPNALRLLENS